MVTETKVKLRAIGSCIAPTAFLVLVGAVLLKTPPLVPPGPAQHLRPSQVSLMVPDLEEALRWYEETLGFVRLSVVALEGRPAHALLARDSNVLELVDGGGSLGPARASLAGSTITISRVPLILDDVDGEIEQLRERGVEIVREPRVASKRDLRVGVVRDLNGRIIEVQQPL